MRGKDRFWTRRLFLVGFGLASVAAVFFGVSRRIAVFSATLAGPFEDGRKVRFSKEGFARDIIVPDSVKFEDSSNNRLAASVRYKIIDEKQCQRLVLQLRVLDRSQHEIGLHRSVCEASSKEPFVMSSFATLYPTGFENQNFKMRIAGSISDIESVELSFYRL